MRGGEYTDMYLEAVGRTLRAIREQEMDRILEVAELMADEIAEDKLIHVYGTGGHSIMGAEEMFMRSGGLVPINPIWDQGMSLIFGVKIVERVSGYAKTIIEYYEVNDGDLLIIISIPGINAVTVDAALEAKSRGAVVVGISSKEFCDQVPHGHAARHPSNRSLSDVADIFIDTHVPFGDVSVEIPGCKARVAPLSTIAHAFIVNSLVVETAGILASRGIEPPIWISQNIPGGDEENQRYYQAYRHRVKGL